MSSTNVAYDPDFVKRAAADLMAARPAYRDLIGFYADIFAAQEEARPQIRIEPFHLPPDLVRIKLNDQFPLMQPSEMRFDSEVVQGLFRNLCRITVDHGSKLAEAGSMLRDHAAVSGDLFGCFLEGNESRIKETAAACGVKPEALSFFLHHSLRPALCRCAQELSGFLPDDFVWEKGYCPICGSLPVLGWLEADGQRHFFCSFCWHRWPARRLLCPFCSTCDPHQLSYLYSEEEKEYRVEVCDACRKYIKTIDSRQLPRLAYPPLEQMASLHLDFKAAEAGYAAGLTLHVEGCPDSG
jgi:FdhE protein